MRITFAFLPLTVLLFACSGLNTPPDTKSASNGNELIMVDVRQGAGAEATTGQQISVHYTGWLYDEDAPRNRGKKFDSSLDRAARPYTFVLGIGSVISGWDQGFVGMKVGGKRTLIIPSELGYGTQGQGGMVPPNATMIFDVELLSVR